MDAITGESLPVGSGLASRSDGAHPPGGAERWPRRLAWAELLRHVFAIDVLECPRCGGRMRVLAAIHPPETTEAILDCLGLPSRAPPAAPPAPDEIVEDAGGEPGFDVGG